MIRSYLRRTSGSSLHIPDQSINYVTHMVIFKNHYSTHESVCDSSTYIHIQKKREESIEDPLLNNILIGILTFRH